MGIFFNTCEALVDRATGRALTGDALHEAQRHPGWQICGNKVFRLAKFCRKCGKGAPGGWIKCPQCGKWIGNDSRFCSHCNAPLYPDDRSAMAGGVWQKERNLFAQRFEIEDIKALLSRKLQVQQGTAAILMGSGAVLGVLEAGSHEPDALSHRINWFSNPPPRSVVLLDVGEIIVPIRFGGIRTSEHIPLEFYGEAVMRFRGGIEDAKSFCANLMKGERSIDFEKIAQLAEPLLRTAVDEVCSTSTLEDLVKDPERRIRLQERMEARLAEDFAAYGFEVVRVSSAEFGGNEYKKIEQQLGEAELARREAEYKAALESTLRKIAVAAEKEETQAAYDLQQYKEMIDNEYRVSAETRAREFEMLKRSWAHDDRVYQRLLEIEEFEHAQEMQRKTLDHAHEMEKKQATHSQEMETAAQLHSHQMEERQADHDLSTSRKLDDYAREKSLADTRAAVEAQKMRSAQEGDDAKMWLDVKAQKIALKVKEENAAAERRRGMSLNELLVDTQDPEARAALLEALRMQRNVNMTPEQLLAELGKESTSEQYIAKLEVMYRSAQEREDRNLSKMLEPAIEAARARPTVIRSSK